MELILSQTERLKELELNRVKPRYLSMLTRLSCNNTLRKISIELIDDKQDLTLDECLSISDWENTTLETLSFKSNIGFR
jgi:hypothetical protein